MSNKKQETYTGFSGIKFEPDFIQAISWTVVREPPSYHLGSPNPRSFGGGQKTITGEFASTKTHQVNDEIEVIVVYFNNALDQPCEKKLYGIKIVDIVGKNKELLYQFSAISISPTIPIMEKTEL